MLACLLLLALGSEPGPLVQAADRRFERHADELEHAALEGIVGVDELWLRAAEIRRGLGQHARAGADLDAREAAHRDDPGRVAALFWSRRALLGSDDERLAHAERYLKRHARHGRRDHHILAEATAGEVLWRRACPRGDHDLDCLTILLHPAVGHSGRDLPFVLKKKSRVPPIPDRYRGISKRCTVLAGGVVTTSSQAPWGRARRVGGAYGGVVTVHPRDARLAARAQQHLARAARLARDVELPDDTREEVRAALALAAVYRLDPQLWSLLALMHPTGLRFAPDPWADDRTRARQAREVDPSRRKHAAFLRALESMSAALREQYAALLRDEAAARLPALHLRAGLVEALVVLELGHAVIPAGQASEADAVKFCAGFAPQVAAAEDATVAAWTRCVAAGALHSHDRVAERCEGLLAHHYPREWPATAEMFAEPGPVWPTAYGVQLVADPDDDGG